MASNSSTWSRRHGRDHCRAIAGQLVDSDFGPAAERCAKTFEADIAEKARSFDPCWRCEAQLTRVRVRASDTLR